MDSPNCQDSSRLYMLPMRGLEEMGRKSYSGAAMADVRRQMSPVLAELAKTARSCSV